MSYLGNKEQKAMFLVVYRSDAHFDLARQFLACAIRVQVKMQFEKSDSIN